MNTQTTTPAALQVQTIDINAKEWFDRTYGNSYFAGYVTINYGLPNAITLNMPFHYGYGDYYQQYAGEMLKKAGYTNEDKLYKLKEAGVIVRANIQTGCKKRELMEY